MNVLNKCFIIIAIIILYPLWATAQMRGLDGSVLNKIENGSVIALWPRGTSGVNPDIPEEVKPCGKRFFNIHNPNITVYKPENPNGVALVLAAGGGYNYIASGVEGIPVAEKLNQAGITVFILKYRLPPTPGASFGHPVPLSDALRALQLVRYHAAEFNIDPGKIGIMGFSAGGHLASAAGTLFSNYTFGNDNISTVSSRPDFMCLVYSAMATKEGKALSDTQLLNSDLSQKQIMESLFSELNVTTRSPPAFLVHAQDDPAVNPQNSILMYKALQTMGIPAELKLYKKGGHGFGPGRPGTDSEKWTDDFIAWLYQMNFISAQENENKLDECN
jgi:acetyl esterase/lipase